MLLVALLAGVPDVSGNGRQQLRQQRDAEKYEPYVNPRFPAGIGLVMPERCDRIHAGCANRGHQRRAGARRQHCD
jgi:hypothetical protein